MCCYPACAMDVVFWLEPIPFASNPESDPHVQHFLSWRFGYENIPTLIQFHGDQLSLSLHLLKLLNEAP